MRVAVIGQGSIGRRHAALALAAGCSVVAWDPTGAVLDGVAAAASVDDCLARADAAVIASPSVLHLEQAALALRAGCHVLVEKPVAVSAAGVGELRALAAATGLVAAVAMNLRFHPGPALVRSVVLSGEIGRPLLAEVTFGSWLPGWRPSVDYRTSYSARAELGGGVALDAIHEIDYAQWVLGAAVESGGRLARVSDLELDVEDVALLWMRHSGGAISSVVLDYLDRSYRRGCRVVGSDASVEWSWPDASLRVLGSDGVVRSEVVPSDVAPAYAAQLDAFLRACAAGSLAAGEPLASLEDGEAAVRVVDAARAAS